MSHIGMVTENQLDEWVRGNSRDAQGVIVELVWRLVAASSPNPKDRRFPLGDSIGQHGSDGILDVDFSFEPFIPEGRSFWEIGTGLNANAKANSDYNDSITAIPASIRLKSTFIFVTPLSGRRDWEHTWKEEAQATWLDTHRSKNDWLGVRVIDGTKLVDWMHQFPSVEQWCAQKMFGSQALQIDTLERHWNLTKTIGDPPLLIPQVFLANREDANSKLKEVFAGNSIQLRLDTHFPNQIVDFVAAAWAELNVESRIEISGRCLVISGIEAWNTVVEQREKHILIADTNLDLSGDPGTKLIQKARRAGHAIIFSGAQGGIPDPARITLREARPHQLKDALVKAGYAEERARTLSQKCGGNLGSLLRLLQNLSSMPEWAQGTDAAELAVAIFIGSWDEKSEADRTSIEGVLGKSYGEWIGKMREIAQLPGTPLIQRDGSWKFNLRYEGWYALGPRLFNEHLDRLMTVAISIFLEKDPKFDLPPEKRFAASIHGKVQTHSNKLRSGVANCLALLGSHPSALTSCALGKAETTAALIVRSILDDADWIRWASLDDLLPFLAEAAPEEFMNAVEKALNCEPCPFNELFLQEGDGMMTGGSYISGLLWALETLAWDEQRLTRVVVLLGKLAARDTGGRFANRPANSLTTILLPWMPQTCASVERRGSAVSTLLKELPEIGWKLLKTLLPNAHQMTSGSRRPAWRTAIPDDWPEGVTDRQRWEQEKLYADLAVTIAIDCHQKLVELIKEMDHLPLPAREKLLTYLASDTVVQMPEAEKLDFWTELVDLSMRHRKFADAGWAMKPEWVDKMVAVAEKLAPQTPIYRYQRLFSERDFDLYEENGNWEKQNKKLQELREKAVQEILVFGGASALLAFADSVESPWRAGIAAGVVAEREIDANFLPLLLESEKGSHANFVGGFVAGRHHKLGWKWIDSLDFNKWTITQMGQFLSFLPFTQETWEWSKRLLAANEASYWTTTRANPYETETGLEYAIYKLIEHGRPHAAIRCLRRTQHLKLPFDNALAVRALMAALTSSENAQSMDAYDIIEIIKALQSDPATNADALFKIEWAYLSLLDRDEKAYPRLIEWRLANEPKLFCEVIRLIFRSKNEEQPTEELTEQTRNKASNAYRLLHGWKTPPGLRKDGTYNGDDFSAWLMAAKKECANTGHLEVAMTMVGQVLSNTPPDPDGLWIHRSVAQALNEEDAKDMRDGFCMEFFNSRGAHWVDPTAKPEKELASKYRLQGDTIEAAGFHRLANSLRSLASSYDREAEQILSRETFGD